MSRDLDSSRPWLDPANPVLLPHVLKAAQRSGRPVREVHARMARLGLRFDFDLDTLPIDQFDAPTWCWPAATSTAASPGWTRPSRSSCCT